MDQATHIDMTLTVARAIGWSKDDEIVKLLAREAASPDAVRTIQVEGVGAHLFGRNFASLVHFCVPASGRTLETATFKGYNWPQDKSHVRFNIPNKNVIPCPREWLWPIAYHLPFESTDPLYELVEDLKNPKTKGSLAADEITYPEAGSYAAWFAKCYAHLLSLKPRYSDLDRALATLAGRAVHFVGDSCIPHHAAGCLLSGHCEFESGMHEKWISIAGDPVKLALRLESARRHAFPCTTHPKNLCHALAWESYRSPDKLDRYQTRERGKWDRLMSDTIDRALIGTFSLLEHLMRSGWLG